MNNERYYLLTGAAGFLGSNICAQLLAEGKKVRALVLPNDKSVKFIPKEVEVVIGDLCDEASLEPFFTVPGGCTSVIIHCASMVTVDPVAVYKFVEKSVVGAYKAVEKGAVDERHGGCPRRHSRSRKDGGMRSLALLLRSCRLRKGRQ